MVITMIADWFFSVKISNAKIALTDTNSKKKG